MQMFTMRYALYILETLAWRLFFSRTLVHCGLRLICCPGNEKTIQNIRYWALITDELWINHKDFKCTVATVFTNVFERLHKQIKWIRVNNECQRSFHCLTSNHLSLQQPSLHFRLLGKLEALYIYWEMNELFKLMLIQLTRIFFLRKLPITHFYFFFFFFSLRISSWNVFLRMYSISQNL